MVDLREVAEEIKEIIRNRQQELSLTFVEDTHTYYMKDLNGIIRSNFPSVSTVLKSFYTEFPAEAKALSMCDGDVEAQLILLKEWADTADYATNMGSRVHFLLEKYLVALYGDYKAVRQPIFECDHEQVFKGNKMITAGVNYISLMHDRGAILLDTEMVLGCPELMYTGQPDKVWLIVNKKGEISFLISDWKTNKEKNMKVQPYTVDMLPPFEKYPDIALSHYYLQLPLYARLILKMLKGSKYENLNFSGYIVVWLRDDGTYQEFRIPSEVTSKVLTMDLKPFVKMK